MNTENTRTYAEQLLLSWHPSHNWRPQVQAAYRQVTRAESDRKSFKGWAQVAAMLGDCGASPLCLIVSLYSQSLLPRGQWDKQLTGYLNISLLALGLATPRYDSTCLIKNIGNPDTVEINEQKLQQWLQTQLAVFAGDLQKAAIFSLRLAALRTGVVEGPRIPIIAQMLNDDLWPLEQKHHLDRVKHCLWWFAEKLSVHEVLRH